MVQFNDWCLSVDEQVGNHFRRVMSGQAANIAVGVDATAALVPGHYAAEDHVARALARLRAEVSQDVGQIDITYLGPDDLSGG